MTATLSPVFDLPPLDDREAAGITFSYVSSRTGFVTTDSYAQGEAERARVHVERALESDRYGVVPRTQLAVDLLAEVLA
jgi:hypothetical protein